MEATTSNAAFEAFAVDGTLGGTDVRVVLNHDVDVVDEVAGLSRRGTVAEFRHDSLPAWNAGDMLLVDGSAYRVQDTLFDDGYIIRIYCSGATAP